MLNPIMASKRELFGEVKGFDLTQPKAEVYANPIQQQISQIQPMKKQIYLTPIAKSSSVPRPREN